jgi:tetratricopeptide (TPR) repeat protein
MKRLGLLGLGVLALTLAGAAPDNAAVEALLRRGNAAFEAGNYAVAADLYDKAEVRATDPGQVAYNRATALYRRALAEEDSAQRAKLLRAAELDYRCCAAAKDEPRRSRALFGLANCLLQGRGDEVAATREAIRCYRACLNSKHLEAALVEDARHNLELAKLLWLKARAKKDSSSEKDPNDPQQNDSSQRQQGEDPERMQGGDPGSDPNNPGGKRQQVQPGDGRNPIETQQKNPGGSGELPPGEEADKDAPLTPEKARADLTTAVKRIASERDTRRIRSTRSGERPVKDW